MHLCGVAWERLLSYFRPVRVWRGIGRWGPLEICWENGTLVLNGPRSNQSFGSLHRVWQLALHDTLGPGRPAGPVLMLGFGAGSAAHILRHQRNVTVPITAVELDPMMVRLAHEHFDAGTLTDLTIVQGDALSYVQAGPRVFDLVLVDLFHDLDLAPGVESPDFLRALAERTRPDGDLLFNTVVHDAVSKARSERVGLGLRQCFERVEELRLEGLNRVFHARSPRIVD